MAHPAIDFERAGGVDLDRLERSLRLEGRRVGEGRYHVVGGDHDHWVDRLRRSSLAGSDLQTHPGRASARGQRHGRPGARLTVRAREIGGLAR